MMIGDETKPIDVWYEELGLQGQRTIKNIIFLENVASPKEAIDALKEVKKEDPNGKIWVHKTKSLFQVECHYYSRSCERHKAHFLSRKLATNFSWEFFHRGKSLGYIDQYQGQLLEHVTESQKAER